PFPGGSAAQYHFDLARNFFPSGDVELSERQLLTARLKQFEQLFKRALDNPNNLLVAFQTQDSLDLEVNRHVVYLALRYYADTRNTDSQAASEELQSVAATPLGALDSEIVSKPATLFERLEETQPVLRRYRFTIENARRRAAHPGPSSATQVP